jgi:hypothetical protein
MNAARCIPILAVVTTDERGVVEAAAGHLADALSKATGETWTCRCDFATDLSAISGATAGSVVVTSLCVQLARLDTPWADLEQVLRSSYSALCETGDPIMICTILRHVEGETDREKADQTRRRLRQLNLLATELSREYGALIIDLDRILADIGARRLNTDHRLGGTAAVDVAGKAVAVSIVANALDAFAPVDAQDAARAILESYRPAVATGPEIKPTNLMALGRGRRKQLASTVTDTVQENHVVWLIRQVLTRQIGPGEAFDKLVQAVRRRGARESVALLASGIARLFRSQT